MNRKNKYRYRYTGSTTYSCEKRFDWVIKRMGLDNITKIRGYIYKNKYGSDSYGIMLYTNEGTARFIGLCWGYGGTGPQGLAHLLIKLNIPDTIAIDIAFNREYHDKPWEINRTWRGWTRMPNEHLSV